MNKYSIILLFLIGLFSGCTEEVIPTDEEKGYVFYPVKIGSYWIYDVTDTRYTRKFNNQPGDSIRYQIRERVDTVFRDQTNQLTYQLIRSRRNNNNQAWGADSIVLVQKSSSDVRLTHNNIRTINLVFPVKNEKKWNGNAYNNLGEEEFTYSSMGDPFSIRDTTFQNTVQVIKYFNENAIELDDRREIYAAGVGLIYKRTIDYDYCNNPSAGCEIGKGFITKGVKRIQRIRSYRIAP